MIIKWTKTSRLDSWALTVISCFGVWAGTWYCSHFYLGQCCCYVVDMRRQMHFCAFAFIQIWRRGRLMIFCTDRTAPVLRCDTCERLPAGPDPVLWHQVNRVLPDWDRSFKLDQSCKVTDDVRSSPAIREIHTQVGACPGPSPVWRLRGLSRCILQASASAMLQASEQTVGRSRVELRRCQVTRFRLLLVPEGTEVWAYNRSGFSTHSGLSCTSCCRWAPTWRRHGNKSSSWIPSRSCCVLLHDVLCRTLYMHVASM